MRVGVCLLLLALPAFSQKTLRFILTSNEYSANVLKKSAEYYATRINNDNRYISASVQQTLSEDEKSLISVEVDGIPLVKNEQFDISNPSKSIKKSLATAARKYFQSRFDPETDPNWWQWIAEFDRVYSPRHLLSSAEFDAFLDSSSGGKHSFIVFYKSGDSFAHWAAFFSGVKAASKTEAQIAFIDCSQSSDLCDQKETPTIIAYQHGKIYSTYDGILATEEISDWILTLRQPAVKRLTEDIVPRYRSGLIDGFDRQRSAVTMLFVPNKKDSVYHNFQRFARENHGKHHLGVLVDEGVAQWAHHPALVQGKPFEKIKQAYVNYEDLSYAGIEKFVKEGEQPTLHELVDAHSTLNALNLNRPLVIFFDPSAKKNSTNFAQMASEPTIRSTLATFGILKGMNFYGLFVLDYFGLEKLKPSYVIVDVSKKCLHATPIVRETQHEILHWIKTNLEEDCKEKVEFDLNQLQHLAERELEGRILQESLQDEKLTSDHHGEL